MRQARHGAARAAPIWRFWRKLAIIRWPDRSEDPFELQTGARAMADHHAADRHIRRYAAWRDGEPSDYRGPATGSHELEKI
ncbi:hypothetical protein [Burkholderia sp. MS455]|uniref:hypothetical protein n=1 Tax=Burkholderia sp. MS455 TaxID=2811788 RepID=UPI001EF55DB9|nr:hypothetical protein [Burkholderia sp. MS455]